MSESGVSSLANASNSSGRTDLEASKTKSGEVSQEDCVNNNVMMEGCPSGDATTAPPVGKSNSPTKMELMHHPKDEYMEDPLPDLVGNLKITEEPEPDLTVLDQEFVLEDFEFHISDEEDEEHDDMLDDESSGSDLEFFDATTASISSSSMLDGSLVPETENVCVDFDHQFSINNCDAPQESSSGASSGKLANVRNTAKRVAARVKNMVGKNKSGKGNGHVRVMYHNLDKPYVARVSPAQHFKNFLTLGEGDEEPNANPMGRLSQSNSITSDIGSPIDPNMTAEELQAARAEWQGELTQVEDEISTLRQVLNSKLSRAHALKKKLGITAWSEITQDMGQGIKNVRDSTAVQKIEETLGSVTTAVTAAPLYQKTESAIKATAEKTTSLFGGIGSAVSQKIGALKNTESFRSMEERVTGAVSAVKVKTRMGGSRSGSVQSFDEALREATANQAAAAGANNPDGSNRPNGTPTATTPSVEDKPIS
ncbi:unnamed protein product [Orchesella dallaii]|uniref:Tumor protein D54 n=1 Tax=Orchesella dallaii TaxID=48710 RepID=A0ABP1PSX5_9HEXA